MSAPTPDVADAAPRSRRRLSRAERALRALAVAALLLLVLELATRLVLSSPRVYMPHPEFGFMYRPLRSILHTREGYSRTRTNSLGFVDDELLAERPGRRTLLLGDSFSAAVEVPRGECFASLVEARLGDHELINAGQPGWGPLNQLLLLRSWGPRLLPDQVVLQVNDPDLESLRATRGVCLARDERGEWVVRLVPDRSAYARAKGAAVLVCEQSALATALSERLELLVSAEAKRYRRRFSPGPAAPAPPILIEEVRAPLRWVLGRLQRETPRLVVLYLPSLNYRGGAATLAHPERQALYVQTCAELGIELVDASEAMQAAFARDGQPLHGFQNSLMGQGHLNSAGHAVVGALLSDALGR